jgi:hypothetical protein
VTLHLNINPVIESRLVARARASGLPLEAFVEGVLEREATAPCTNGSQPLTGAEKAKAFREWASNFPPDLPVLSLDDVSRESVYRRD